MTTARTATGSTARMITVVLLLLTVGQLAVGAFAGLDQFDGKNFTARLVLYPAMMLLLPAIWWLRERGRDEKRPAPWAAFAWVMLPFLIDVTGNTLNLYDSLWWWDDLNHLVNWLFLSLGLGLLLSRTAIRPAWALGLLIAGVGAMLAIGWEIGEYYAFIRNGTELDTAYTDTLGDEALGTLGSCLAGLLLARQWRPAGQVTTVRSD